MTKKLIVRISGGLGNQLYTYAAALRLAKKNDAQLLIDPYSGFTKDFYQQPFQLDKLSVSAPIASDSDCFISRISRFKWSLLRRLNKQLPYIKRWVIFEEQSPKKKTAFDSRLLDFKLHKKNIT